MRFDNRVMPVVLLGFLWFGNQSSLLYPDQYSSVMECYQAETGYQGLPPRSEMTSGEKRIAEIVLEECEDLFD